MAASQPRSAHATHPTSAAAPLSPYEQTDYSHRHTAPPSVASCAHQSPQSKSVDAASALTAANSADGRAENASLQTASDPQPTFAAQFATSPPIAQNAPPAAGTVHPNPCAPAHSMPHQCQSMPAHAKAHPTSLPSSPKALGADTSPP